MYAANRIDVGIHKIKCIFILFIRERERERERPKRIEKKNKEEMKKEALYFSEFSLNAECVSACMSYSDPHIYTEFVQMEMVFRFDFDFV